MPGARAHQVLTPPSSAFTMRLRVVSNYRSTKMCKFVSISYFSVFPQIVRNGKTKPPVTAVLGAQGAFLRPPPRLPPGMSSHAASQKHLLSWVQRWDRAPRAVLPHLLLHLAPCRGRLAALSAALATAVLSPGCGLDLLDTLKNRGARAQAPHRGLGLLGWAREQHQSPLSARSALCWAAGLRVAALQLSLCGYNVLFLNFLL